MGLGLRAYKACRVQGLLGVGFPVFSVRAKSPIPLVSCWNGSSRNSGISIAASLLHCILFFVHYDVGMAIFETKRSILRQP